MSLLPSVLSNFAQLPLFYQEPAASLPTSLPDLLGQVQHLLTLPDGAQLSDWSLNSLVIAQYKDTLGNDVQNAWNEFVNTGRAWALLLGLVVGYLFSKLTSF
jgi:hypothetical protein